MASKVHLGRYAEKAKPNQNDHTEFFGPYNGIVEYIPGTNLCNSNSRHKQHQVTGNKPHVFDNRYNYAINFLHIILLKETACSIKLQAANTL